jgi:hypothetical protein
MKMAKLTESCYGFVGEKLKDAYCQAMGITIDKLDSDIENLLSSFGFMLVNEKFDFVTRKMIQNESEKVIKYTKLFSDDMIKRVIAKKEKEIAELKGYTQ